MAEEKGFMVCVRVKNMSHPTDLFGTPVKTSCNRCFEDVWVTHSPEVLEKLTDGVEIVCHVCASSMIAKYAERLDFQAADSRLQGIADAIGQENILQDIMERGLRDG